MAAPRPTEQKPSEGVQWRRYKEGEKEGAFRWLLGHDFPGRLDAQMPECPVSTPPCQGSCPAGEDIRGYLNIVRGIESACRRDLAGICVPPRDRSQPFPGVMVVFALSRANPVVTATWSKIMLASTPLSTSLATGSIENNMATRPLLPKPAKSGCDWRQRPA